MAKYYTNEKSAQIIISLLKEHGISRIIVSPGTTNMAIVASMQNDNYFKIYSAVDERSAAYMACGLADESGEPVVLSCTGATASRNYLPGLTEAYYRKLPILAITSTQAISKVGHHIAQVIDRSLLPKDTVTLSVQLPIIKDNDDLWDCEIKVNKAILELSRNGGGPAHINLSTTYDRKYSVEVLPKYNVIKRITQNDCFPHICFNKIAIAVGSHSIFTSEEINVIDKFCEKYNGVVFCDHTSNYFGKYRIQYSLVLSQSNMDITLSVPDLVIHLGEVSGDYSMLRLKGKETWRVNEDGEVRDTFSNLKYVFQMPIYIFFKNYLTEALNENENLRYFEYCKTQLEFVKFKFTNIPFSNIFVASKLANRIPKDSRVYFGILNSLRAWNFYDLPESVVASSNVGGFGIDGGLSSLIGASFYNKERLYFAVIGDLAFFYDMNSIGNRHIGNNLRILLINNGKGTEFRNYTHPASIFADDADKYIAAAGHFGNKSPELVKNYAKSLGFEYYSASNKEEFEKVYQQFVTPEIKEKPILFEVFTTSEDESEALRAICNIIERKESPSIKQIAKKILGEEGVSVIKKVMRK